ncbi:hypothetical protein ACJX0J_035329, partial [Zea mays]
QAHGDKNDEIKVKYIFKEKPNMLTSLLDIYTLCLLLFTSKLQPVIKGMILASNHSHKQKNNFVAIICFFFIQKINRKITEHVTHVMPQPEQPLHIGLIET